MKFLPIDVDENRNAAFRENPDCVAILAVYPGYYRKVGYHPPWIGYFATLNGREMVGSGGYKGQPKDGAIEIAYGTFKPYEGQGIGTRICRKLVELARQTNPALRITARTLPDNHASMRILQKNGFTCRGTVHDEDDGEVLEWEFDPTLPDPFLTKLA